MKYEIGVIGLGVMGKSLSRNLAQKGALPALYNRHVAGSEEKVAESFIAEHAALAGAGAFDALKPFVDSLARPRKIILMVNAGAAVDSVLNDLLGLLSPGDIVLDGGNSHYQETQRRAAAWAAKGLHFLGAGISGGEKGALLGPSIMPSGNRKAYDEIAPFLAAIAAKDAQGQACCTYVGEQGSGHFVKMIHNGIEYVEMQLIAECYALLKQAQYSNDEIAAFFEAWCKDVGSYLLEISAKILRVKTKGEYLIDQILDQAGNKGTGKWSTETIAQVGEAASLIPAALLARYLSFFKAKREAAQAFYAMAPKAVHIETDHLKAAYRFSRIVNHHQGFSMIAEVAKKEDWGIDLTEIARIWTQGCIIKSDLMQELVHYLKEGDQLLMHSSIKAHIKQDHTAAKKMAATAIEAQVHAPCLLEAVNFFHGYTSAQSSANLIQAQRDFFGAHTYQRIDDLSGKSYHTHWEKE